jgi:hypothetical protein
LFATPADGPSARRASDLVTLVGSSLSLAAVSFAAVPAPGFADAVSRLLAALPGFLDTGWQFLSDLLALVAVLLSVGTLMRRRWSIARDLLLAVGVAIIVWLVAGRLVEGSWPAIWDSLRAAAPPSWYPLPRLALCGAVVLTASPHLTRPVRRLAGLIVALGAFGVAALGATAPLGAIAGVLVAAVAAAAVHLAVGSSGGRPPLELVRAALAELGVRTTELGAADRQQAGLFVVNTTGDDGAPLIVKVYGRDAHDAALLSTLWRTVWYREAGSPLRFGRLQQVEHEAFLTLFAGQAGIHTGQALVEQTNQCLVIGAHRGTAGQVDYRSGDRCGAVRCHEDRRIGDLGQGRQPPQQGQVLAPLDEHLLDARTRLRGSPPEELTGVGAVGNGICDRVWSEADDAHAARPELDRKPLRHRLDRGTGGAVAEHPGRRVPGPGRRQRQDRS